MKNHKSYFSIKRRLTGSVIAVACGLVILSLYCSFQAARHEIKEVYDARLGQTAKLILNVTSISPNEQNKIFHHEQLEQWMRNIQKVAKIDDDKDSEYGHPYEQNTLLQLYQNGELAWSSNPSMEPLSSKSNFDGYGDIYVQGDQWRFFRLHSTPEQYVVVAEKQSIRQEMINEIAFSTALPQLALIPILVLLVIFLINKNFQPISELRSAIAQRNAHKLDRIYVENQTFELSPLVETINELLQQLEQAWQREKRFTNMAAHELKTPLTILRLNAENALNTKDQEQLSEDLNNILQGIDRTDRLLHQLLTLARVGSITCLNKKPLQLQDILKETLAHLAPLAIKNNQELSFSGGSSFIMGDELLLSILFRNLIDNAIRYSGPRAQIEVTLNETVDSVEVDISDTGVNISSETRLKMFDRFYRANTEKGDGAGLGMSITRDIAALHNATVALLPRNNQRNTFRVTFTKA